MQILFRDPGIDFYQANQFSNLLRIGWDFCDCSRLKKHFFLPQLSKNHKIWVGKDLQKLLFFENLLLLKCHELNSELVWKMVCLVKINSWVSKSNFHDFRRFFGIFRVIGKFEVDFFDLKKSWGHEIKKSTQGNRFKF